MRDFWSVCTVKFLPSTTYWKCFITKQIASNSLSKVLHVVCVGFNFPRKMKAAPTCHLLSVVKTAPTTAFNPSVMITNGVSLFHLASVVSSFSAFFLFSNVCIVPPDRWNIRVRHCDASVNGCSTAAQSGVNRLEKFISPRNRWVTDNFGCHRFLLGSM